MMTTKNTSFFISCKEENYTQVLSTIYFYMYKKRERKKDTKKKIQKKREYF